MTAANALAALTGATIAELMGPAWVPPPRAAAMRYQHAANERDKIAAAAPRLARGE